MANKVTFDYSLTENVISADEIKSMEKITNDAKELLHLVGGRENIAAVLHCITRM